MPLRFAVVWQQALDGSRRRWEPGFQTIQGRPELLLGYYAGRPAGR